MTIKAGVLALLGACVYALSAASTAQIPATAGDHEAAHSDTTDAQSTSPTQLSFGIDANGNGIFDEVERFTLPANSTIAKSQVNSRTPIEQQLDLALRDSHVSRQPPKRRTCFDYLMLDPKDRTQADRRLQARTHGVFGSHPCDPVVSATQERPFDTDFIEVPLIPGTVRMQVPGEITGKK